MIRKEVEAGWFSMSVGLKMLIDEGLPPEEIKEKFSRIVDYLMTEHESEKEVKGLLMKMLKNYSKWRNQNDWSDFR